MKLLSNWEAAVVFMDKIDTMILETNKQLPENAFELTKRRPRATLAPQMWKSFRDIYTLFLAGGKVKPEVHAILRKWVTYHRLGWKVGFKLTEQEAARFLNEVVETSQTEAPDH